MKDKDIFFLAIATLITAMSWVIFDAYHAYTTSTTPKALEEIALPITPKIDTNVIRDLKNRKEPEIFTYTAPVSSKSATISAVKTKK